MMRVVLVLIDLTVYANAVRIPDLNLFFSKSKPPRIPLADTLDSARESANEATSMRRLQKAGIGPVNQVP
jgi:hypothetical protein